ncbi:unnamed protein product [Meloidogyne enterolobii]|uniref:Uncharacterized protein n=1 Tax=Meloidogyne enterolobii TaxID=390850 RepID=A0ACB1ABW5_MELEN
MLGSIFHSIFVDLRIYGCQNFLSLMNTFRISANQNRLQPTYIGIVIKILNKWVSSLKTSKCKALYG